MSSPARLLLLAAVLAAPAPALAKAWHGIEPGVADKSAVLKAFGEPEARKEKQGRVVFRYGGEYVIDGHTALFNFDERHVVREIHVFPPKATPIQRSTILGTYGKRYVEKLTDSLQVYWWYPALGLVVFFDSKGNVDTFIFKEPDEQAPKPPDAAKGK